MLIDSSFNSKVIWTFRTLLKLKWIWYQFIILQCFLLPNGIFFWIDDNYPMVVLKSFGWVLNCHLMINVLGHSCNDLTTNLERWCQLTIGHHWLGQYLLWQLHFYINGYFFLFNFWNQQIICVGFENNPAFFYVVLLNWLLIYGLILLLGIDNNSYVLCIHGFCS